MRYVVRFTNRVYHLLDRETFLVIRTFNTEGDADNAARYFNRGVGSARRR